MKNKICTLIIFICSLIVLIISLKLFWNMGVYVDEHNTSPVEVYGGGFWNIAAWLRLLLLAAITAVSGIGLFKKNN